MYLTNTSLQEYSKQSSQPSYLSGGIVGIEMTGTDDLFLASNLRAFFIFWRDSSRAASPVPPVPLEVASCLLEESVFPLGRESESTSPPGV
jgi:hypothetical protein